MMVEDFFRSRFLKSPSDMPGGGANQNDPVQAQIQLQEREAAKRQELEARLNKLPRLTLEETREVIDLYSRDCYARLGVPRDSTTEEILAAADARLSSPHLSLKADESDLTLRKYLQRALINQARATLASADDPFVKKFYDRTLEALQSVTSSDGHPDDWRADRGKTSPEAQRFLDKALAHQLEKVNLAYGPIPPETQGTWKTRLEYQRAEVARNMVRPIGAQELGDYFPLHTNALTAFFLGGQALFPVHPSILEIHVAQTLHRGFLAGSTTQQVEREMAKEIMHRVVGSEKFLEEITRKCVMLVKGEFYSQREHMAEAVDVIGADGKPAQQFPARLVPQRYGSTEQYERYVKPWVEYCGFDKSKIDSNPTFIQAVAEAQQLQAAQKSKE